VNRKDTLPIPEPILQGAAQQRAGPETAKKAQPVKSLQPAESSAGKPMSEMSTNKVV
jgi:hypothetical protein